MQVQRQADVRGQIVVRHADDALQIAARMLPKVSTMETATGGWR